MSRVNHRAAVAALTKFMASPEAGMSDAMAEAIEAALPHLDPARHPLPEDLDARRTVATIDIGHGSDYRWAVVSDCGVVKLYSTRDGCMLAVDPTTARLLARELCEAIEDAASATERASRGESRSPFAREEH